MIAVSGDQSVRIPGGPVGILLIHELGGTPGEMRRLANELARPGHTLHVPQLAGHCRTVDDLEGTIWQDWYATVEKEHYMLRESCNVVVVGGLSMGAVLALHHAAQHPRDIVGAILYAPCLWRGGWAMQWCSALLDLVRHRLLTFADCEPRDVKNPPNQAVWPQVMSDRDSAQAGIAAPSDLNMLEQRRLIKQVKLEIPQVRQPTLVIHLREDDHASLRNLEYMQANLGGPITAVMLDSTYPTVTIDQQRELIVDRSLRFIAQVTKPSGPTLGAENNL